MLISEAHCNAKSEKYYSGHKVSVAFETGAEVHILVFRISLSMKLLHGSERHTMTLLGQSYFPVLWYLACVGPTFSYKLSVILPIKRKSVLKSHSEDEHEHCTMTETT